MHNLTSFETDPRSGNTVLTTVCIVQFIANQWQVSLVPYYFILFCDLGWFPIISSFFGNWASQFVDYNQWFE